MQDAHGEGGDAGCTVELVLHALQMRTAAASVRVGVRAFVWACVRACVRACRHACLRARVCGGRRACVHVRMRVRPALVRPCTLTVKR